LSKVGSTAAGIIVSVLIVASVGALGYYQFVIAPNIATTISTTSVNLGNITTIRINITVGAATKTTDAFAPNPLRLIIGKNNSVIFYNVDIQGGVGTAHTATARTMVGGNPVFDTAILNAGDHAGPFLLSSPGSYDYFCQLHPTTMRGTIVVVAAGG
jgi:plastocyanin